MFSKIVVMTAANILVAASGLLRELVLANIYGTSILADLFLTSYLMVEEFNNILFVGLIFGLFSYIKKIEHSEHVINFLFKLIFYMLPAIFLFVTIFYFVFDGANLFLSKDLYRENFSLISKYSSPALSIGLVNSIISCYLLYKEKYFIAIFSKAINYLALAILLVLNPEPANAFYLGSIVSLSYLLQFLFLISFFSKNELSIEKIFSTQINIFEVIKHSSPWILQPILVPFLANIIGRFLMSNFDPGYISSVSYASKLLNLMNTLTFSIILVGFMDIVSKSNEIDKYKKSISDSLTRIIFFTIPITFFCCFYNKEIISILFERGSFNINSVELTSAAFYIFSLSLFPGVFYGYFSRVIGNMKGNKYLNFLTLLQFFIYLSVMIVFLNDFEGYIMPYGYFICTTVLSILILVFYARNIIPKSSYINFFVCILLCSSLFISDTFFEFLSFNHIVKMICSCFILLVTNGTFIMLNKSIKNAFFN